MVLGFKEQFKEKILDGSKIHTIRRDKENRWCEGKIIEFTTEVGTDISEFFKICECLNVQDIFINSLNNIVKVDGEILNATRIWRLSVNDGFKNTYDFFEFFNKNYGEYFTGKIIHWTDFKY